MALDTLQAVAQALGLPLSAAFAGEARLYHLEAEGEHAEHASQLLVEAWTMTEALNAPYELVVTCVSANAYIDVQPLLGQPLRLRSTLSDGGFNWRSGLVSCAEQLDADGGLARYRFTLVPWTWLLQQMQDSAVWQDRSFSALIDDLYGVAHGAAQWRWSAEVDAFLAGGNHGGQRPYVAQYRETHFDFAARLLAAEGLNYRFEEDPNAPRQHTQVLFADSASSEACPEDPTSAAQGGIRFHRANSQEDNDAIQAFGNSLALNPAVTTVLSWDPITKRVVASTVPLGQALNDNAPRLEDYDTLGEAFSDAGAADHYARIRREATECRDRLYIGRSTVRTLRAGTTFVLNDSPLDALAGEKRFLVTRLVSAGINNLPAEVSSAIARRWASGEAGADLLPADLSAEVIAQAEATGYGNSFEAQQANTPWRPHAIPKPRVAGVHTATVVGPNGELQPTGGNEIYCDRLDRIKLRFPWQRGLRADDRSTCWVPVTQWHAGAQMGSRFIPRIGQEVLVGFIEGDIDRPVVRGAVYNGKGEGGVPATPGGQAGDSDTSVFERSHDHAPSGQGNLSGGNSPAWHGAAGPAQNNQAALSGIKTKEVGGSGFNQLVFDDTDGQLRVQLGTTQHATWLNMGHLLHQADNHRGSFRGLGFELRTDAYGAVRAKQGLLISTYGTDPSDPAGDNSAGQALAHQMADMASVFSQAAGTHQTVKLATHLGSIEANKSHLSDEKAPLKALQQVFNGMVSGHRLDDALSDAASKSTSPQAKLPHTTDPVIGIAARGGISLTAGQDILLAAGESIHTAAGQDSSRAIAGAARLHTGQAIGVLAGAVQPGDEAAGTGITLIAGHGDVQVQAQSDTLQIAAKGLINVQSASSHVDWAAAKKITLQTTGGAQIVLEGGGITVQCPGKITVKAATKSMVGAASESYLMPVMPKLDNSWVEMEAQYDDAWNTRWPLDDLKFNLDGTPMAKSVGLNRLK